MMGLCSGTTAMVGAIGAANKQMAGRFAALSVMVFVVDGILLSWVAIPFLDQLMGMFSLPREAHVWPWNYFTGPQFMRRQ